jgi:hypothetical protein
VEKKKIRRRPNRKAGAGLEPPLHSGLWTLVFGQLKTGAIVPICFGKSILPICVNKL